MLDKLLAWDNGQGPWGKSPARTTKKGAAKKPAGKRTVRDADGNEYQVKEIHVNLDPAQLLKKLGKTKMGKKIGGGSRKGGKGNEVAGGLGLFGAVAAVLWLLSGFYIVSPDQEGVVTRFGEYVRTSNPGLNYRLPYPIEAVQKPLVTRENVIEIGFRSWSNLNRPFVKSTYQDNANVQKVAAESLMLTGDENIIDLNFTVRWKISDAADYLFNVANMEDYNSREGTIKHVAESAMREVIGQHPIDDALTAKRGEIEAESLALMRTILESYEAGVDVISVELQQVNPPEAVIDAFLDVQAARADAERSVNEAKSYSNQILPKARGQVAQIMQDAEGYKQARIAQAEGEASRFNAQLTEYVKAPKVTEERLYLETMEKVLLNGKKVILGSEAAQGVLPYLPLGK